MANIILTDKCNISCPFCFASENNVTQDSYAMNFFDIKKTWNISTFLKNKKIRLCGGEPTQNPYILDILEILLKDGYEIFFMTNGVWHEDFFNYIKNLPPKYMTKVSYLFNILPPEFYKNGEYEIIRKSLSIVNPKKTDIGITIYREDFKYDYLLDLAKKNNISRIRWSVAAPNLATKGITIEERYYQISKKVYDLYQDCLNSNIEVHCDCNYIQPCYFNKSDLADMMIQSKSRLTFTCSYSSAVDIDSNNIAWRCYGLYSVLKTNISGFENDIELERYFTRRVRLLDNMYAYEECKSCKYWQNGCSGGCYVFRVKKALKQRPNLVLFPIDDDKEILNSMPYKAPAVVIKNENNIIKLYWKNKLMYHPDENTHSFLNEIDGRKTIKELIRYWENNFPDFDTAKNTVINKCRELFEDDLIQINYLYDVQPEKRPE